MNRTKTLRIPLLIVLVLLAGRIFHANAQTETILHFFASSPYDGAHPEGVLVQGIDGNFYGTTEFGAGTVFRISPSGHETILYYFLSYLGDGEFPQAGLVQGSDGNFYGTTDAGGTSTNCGSQGCGTIFQVSPIGNETNLHSFTGAPDGQFSQAGLVEGSDGSFYGTTTFGGAHNEGTVFRISPSGSETILYSFAGSPDGAVPVAGLVQGNDGNFYGTTYSGGTSTSFTSDYGTGAGTVFRISPGGTYTNLHSFGSSENDSLWPNTGLVEGSDGNFYGTTTFGGTYIAGTVFRISPSGSETILYSFGGYPDDGDAPYAGVVQGSDGNFYGTTDEGGTTGDGTVFRISPNGSETILYSFGSSPNDGQNPLAGLVQGSDGNFYGTTYFGGTNGQGIVFKIDAGLGPNTNNCIFSISSTNAVFVAGGGSGSVNVTASNGCAWDAIAIDGFITITSGVNGFGNGTVYYSVAANTSMTARMGTITIAGQTFTVTQSGSGRDTSTNALILLTNGYGTIQHTAWPKSLVTDKKYTMTAVPKAKNVFSNWVASSSQSFVSTKASLTFTMSSGLVLEANFATNIFLAAQGTYRGLFGPPPSSARQQADSGSFLLTVTSSGTVSGSLDLGGQTVSLSGKFDLGGTANIVSKPVHGIPSLTTTLQLDFADQSVSGTISDSTFEAELNGYRNVFSSSDQATEFEGQYTLVIPGTIDSATGPFGTSYGTVKVSSSGTVTLTGSLADGTAISQSSAVSQDGYWPLYVDLYRGKGSLWGWNYFANQILTASPSLSWINATNSSKTAVYRPGFTNQEAPLMGWLYQPNRPLPPGMTVTLQENNQTIVPTKITLKTNKMTGVITGSFANPANPKQTIKVNGVIIQGQTNAQGYFLDGDQSGTFLFKIP